MAYTKTNWVAGVTPLSEANMDHLETQYDEVANLFDAHSILMAVADNTPVVLTVAASRLIGRTAATDIDDLTGAQVMVILSGQAGADFSMNTNKITNVTDPGADQDAATKKYVDDNLTRELWVPVSGGHTGAYVGMNNSVGEFPVVHLATNNFYALMSFKVPHNYSSITNAEVIVIPDVTDAAANWDITSDYAAAGEAYNTHSEADAATTYNVVQNQIYAVDISGILSAVAAEDYVGIKLLLGDTDDDVYVVGLRFRYS